MLAYGFALAAMALVLPATVTNASPTGFLSFAAQARTMSLADCHFTTAVGVAAGKKKCHKLTLGDIHVPAGQTLDLTGLRDGTHVVFAGKVTFGYAEWWGPLISVSGKRITVTQKAEAVLDGEGCRWWDGLGSNGGVTKPVFFNAHNLTDSRIYGLKARNTPRHAFSVQHSTNLTLDSISLDNRAGLTKGGHNTDAFDVGNSKGVYILNADVHNQDDCLAIRSGSDYLFSNGTCVGGHGLSIGSIGGRISNVLNGVVIRDSRVVNSTNGVRIKTNLGKTGSVNNVTFANIALDNITTYGVDIQQNYLNAGPTGEPTNGISLTNITLDNIHGYVSANATPVFLLCGEGSCRDWTWNKVDITGGVRYTECVNYPKVAEC
ncbi:hypothetical protein ACQY0O_000082 [Thecaphora frezii]